MVLTAIAGARYRMLHGKEPADLNALVPGLLPALPKDWMHGEPLRYRVRDGSRFLLYSLGEDGEDDGGDSTPGTPGKEYRQLRDGRDAVWPIPATGEEVEAAMKSKGE